jgi:EAL domain-containing protein (putative c-di-GMP-specific phosphodiesterase class I)
VPPLQVIPIAEQTGFMRPITLWVFEEAARQQATLLRLGVQRVSVKLSTRDVMEPELPDKLDAPGAGPLQRVHRMGRSMRTRFLDN